VLLFLGLLAARLANVKPLQEELRYVAPSVRTLRTAMAFRYGRKAAALLVVLSLFAALIFTSFAEQ
jgi:hypothetical protein